MHKDANESICCFFHQCNLPEWAFVPFRGPKLAMSWALHCQRDKCANGNRTGRDGALPIHWNRGGLEQISSRWDSKHALINLLSNISIRKWRPDRINVPQWNRLGPSWCKSWENNEVVLLNFSPYTRGCLCYLHLTRKTKTFIEMIVCLLLL